MGTFLSIKPAFTIEGKYYGNITPDGLLNPKSF